MMRRHGISRTVFLTKRWAIKVPSVKYRYPVRGWLGNRSEWKQRKRTDVNPPVFTFVYLFSVYRRLRTLAEIIDGAQHMKMPLESEHESLGHFFMMAWEVECERLGYNPEEAKADQWGWTKHHAYYGEDGVVLIDFDRYWEHPRGIVGHFYCKWQDRKARRITEKFAPGTMKIVLDEAVPIGEVHLVQPDGTRHKITGVGR